MRLQREPALLELRVVAERIKATAAIMMDLTLLVLQNGKNNPHVKKGFPHRKEGTFLSGLSV